MNIELQTFQFDGIPLSIIDQNGEGWMIGEEIGKALEYSEPRKSINNLFDRYRDELEEYSVDIKLVATDGKQYDTRVYNEEGVMMIGFLSKQPKAVAFRKWAVKILKAYRNKELVQHSPYTDELLATQKLLIETQQSLISSTDFRIKEVKEAAQREVNAAVNDRRQYFYKAEDLMLQVQSLQGQLERALRSKSPAKQDERNLIVHLLEEDDWTTKEVAEWAYRSVSVIRKIYREDSRGAA